MKKIKMLPLFFLFTLAAMLLASCGSNQTSLKGADKDAVLAFSEGMTDNLMAGLNANDYAVFSKDFDPAMLSAMNQSQFDTFKKNMDTKFGPYLSREVSGVTQSGNYYAVIYNTKFEKDGNVVMRVVFSKEEPNKVSGLWFNK
jgi:hypothetical protein